MPTILAAIFTGGALGAVTRYGLSGWMHARLGTGFPWGTLAVNLLGSFLLGLLLPIIEPRPADLPLLALVTVGFLGAFTTFSSFAFEAYELVRRGRIGVAGLYAAMSVLLGLAALLGGFALASAIL